MKQILLSIALLLAISVHSAFSQQKFALNVGYGYMQKHTGFAGIDYRLDGNSPKNSHGPLNIGAGAYLYGENGKFALAPEVHLNKTWKHFIVTEISASTKNIKPSVGVTFFNLAHLKFGYSFPVNNSAFNGFFVGFHLQIGKAPFYDEIKVF